MGKRRAAVEAVAWPTEPGRGLVAALRALSDVAPARGAWGEAGPFEGFVPGIATAGALAAELDRVVRGLVSGSVGAAAGAGSGSGSGKREREAGAGAGSGSGERERGAGAGAEAEAEAEVAAGAAAGAGADGETARAQGAQGGEGRGVGAGAAAGGSDEGSAGRARWIFDEALTPGALACRDALTAAAQVAFDAASMVVAERHAPAAVAGRFEALARRWAGVPLALRQLGAVAAMLGAGDALPRAVHRIAARPGSGASVVALCEALLAAGDAERGRAALTAGAPRLGEHDRARLGALLRAVERGATPATLRPLRPGEVIDVLDPLLAPDFGLADALAELAFAPADPRVPR